MFTPTGYSEEIFKSRYALTPQETWKEACLRLAKQMALAEPVERQKYYEKTFYDILINNYFVPGGRIWYNSGKINPQLLNCFVLGNQLDSKEGWGNLAREMIVTSMGGGGCGVEFSDVRPRGSPIGDNKGECPGPVELMRLVDACAKPVKSGGGRRVALMFSLDLDHPDVEEFLDAKLIKGELTYANVSVRCKRMKEFVKAVKEDGPWELSWKGKYKKTISAKALWEKIVKNAYNCAEPGLLNWELVENESNIWYIEQLVTTNPCVTGETEILTEEGYKRIDHCLDSPIKIWNGFEWSEVQPKITGTNQELLSITFSDGRVLNCTPYHKFHISTDYKGGSRIVEAKNLESGMKLIKHDFPIIDSKLELEFAYTQGFVAAEGMELNRTLSVYKPKEMCLERIQDKKIVKFEEKNNRYRVILNKPPVSKNFVPLDYSIKSKIDWLSGLFDGDGCELKEGGLQLASVNREFLFNLQKLFSTLGVQSKVLFGNPKRQTLMPDGRGGKRLFDCQESWRICIGAVQIQKLKSLGLKCERMSFDKTPQRDASQFVTVVDVVENGVAETVYCFNEEKKHLGIFNGVITGQCGEIALSSYDCCCLGHIVLPRFFKEHSIDWAGLADSIRSGIRFLDNVLTVNHYPLPEMKAQSQRLRRIGMGTTGLADMLAMLGIRYGSEDSNKFVEKLYKFIAKIAYESSVMLAVEKGMFPACIPDRHLESGFMKRMPHKIRSIVKEHGIRNCCILTQAPTGTVSILSGNCSSGIEPIFSPSYERRYWDKDERKTELVFHPLFEQFMRENKDVKHFVAAQDVSVEQHMELQAIVQKWTDNAVSKTINMAENYPIEDMSKTWLEYLPRLKGTTFYRTSTRGYIKSDGSIEPPPLTAIPLKEAIQRFKEKHVVEVGETTDCPSGVCEI